MRPETWTSIPYLVASLWTLGIGGGVLLYERFSPESRRFLGLAGTVAVWLAALGVGHGTSDPLVTDWCWRVSVAFQALTAAALFSLAVHLADSPRLRWARAAWVLVLFWFVAALASPHVHSALSALQAGRYGSPRGLLGLAFVFTVVGLVVAAAFELTAGYLGASTRIERRRHLVMLVAMGAGALSLSDYFLSASRLGVPGISFVAISLAVAIFAVGHVRFGAFASDAGFRAEQVLHALGEAVLVCDEAGVVRIANSEARRLLGGRWRELLGRPVTELMHLEAEWPLAEDPAAFIETTLLASGGKVDLRLRPLAGPSIPVAVSTEPLRHGGTSRGYVLVARDLRERLASQRELEVQRRYFAELFEASPEAIALIGEGGEVRRVNSEFIRLFGYSREEAVGRRLDDLIVPGGTREEAAELGRLAAEGPLMRAELVRRRKGGDLVDVSLLARRFNVPGEELQVYAIYRDLSDWKRTEAKLQEREEELRHVLRLESVGKLAGGVAHDFNNLLTVINGHARLLLDEMDPGDPHREDLEEIERAGFRAAELTQQLLAFSRRQVLRPEALDLNAVVTEMDRMLGPLIGSHIRLDTELAPELPLILADRGQVEQVLMNLIVNARDAMPHGGQLVIRTEATTLERADQRLGDWEIEPGPYIHLGVADTGVGMSADVLARAFEPFFTTKARGKGTGLGLSMVIGIVKQSGGHIVAESEPGAGTTFSVYLPAASAEDLPAELQPAPRLDAAVVEPAEATVLVVDDEEVVRNLAVRALKHRGYTVMVAADGQEALDLAADYPGEIDLIVSDLVMPRVGGRELARRIRRARPATRILLISGYDDEMVTGNLEVDDFLPKPFAPSALADRVARLLVGSRA